MELVIFSLKKKKKEKIWDIIAIAKYLRSCHSKDTLDFFVLGKQVIWRKVGESTNNF